MRSLTLTGITASHPGTPVLRGVDLSVPAGTTTTVLGPSGCGKTTLLRVVAGFMRPEAGEVRIGEELVASSSTWLPPERRGFGYVAQEGNLFPHLDITGNILYGVPRADRAEGARVAELLELVGLSANYARRRPDQLSGGQQQRVALARALARRPNIVLLDEPFSALDPELRTATRDAVAAALRHENATVVLVTHDQAEALSFSDQVAIMHHGEFSQVGSPEAVYREPVDRRSATSLGAACFVPGTVTGSTVRCALGVLPVRGARAPGAYEVMIRPEQLVLTAPDSGSPDSGSPGSGSPGVRALVQRVEYFGHDALVEVVLQDLDAADPIVRVRVPGLVVPRPGDAVGIDVAGEVHLIGAGG